PIHNIRPMTEIVASDIAPERFNLTLLAVFAVVALLLAVIGVYGVMSYAVTERRREIGNRIALGAQGPNRLKLVVVQAMWLVLAGVASGVGGALTLTHLIKKLLFEVEAADPLTFIAVSFLLTVVALLACWIPARRATKVDPMIALRCDG